MFSRNRLWVNRHNPPAEQRSFSFFSPRSAINVVYWYAIYTYLAAAVRFASSLLSRYLLHNQ